MKVTMVYVFWDVGSAQRFAGTFQQCPPEHDHLLIVVNNASYPEQLVEDVMGNIPFIQFAGDNRFKDLSAFADVAESVDTEAILCFGCYAFFRRSGWLKRMAEAWDQNGPRLYGTLCSYDVRPHVRTTGFWCPPKLIRSYPFDLGNRYHFEHGHTSFTWWAEQNDMNPLLVTWAGVYPKNQWMQAPDSYHIGNQMNCLIFDKHTG